MRNSCAPCSGTVRERVQHAHDRKIVCREDPCCVLRSRASLRQHLLIHVIQYPTPSVPVRVHLKCLRTAPHSIQRPHTDLHHVTSCEARKERRKGAWSACLMGEERPFARARRGPLRPRRLPLRKPPPLELLEGTLLQA